MNKVYVKKLNDKAILPKYGTDFAAGADLFALIDGESLTIKPGETLFIKTGISLAIPEGYAGFIYARSGLSCKKGLAPANKVGVIDCDYRGEIIVALYNHSNEECVIEQGERIAQIVIEKAEQFEFLETDFLDETDRGEKGFGSTGKK